MSRDTPPIWAIFLIEMSETAGMLLLYLRRRLNGNRR